MDIPAFLTRFERLAVGGLIVIAVTLSALYAVNVPAFMMPDEVAHADYAFSFFDAGRPYWLRTSQPDNYVSPEVRYLVRATGYRKLRYNVFATVRTDLRDSSIRRAIDETAPAPSKKPPPDGSRIPYAAVSYPPLYYALVAAAMQVGYKYGGGSIVDAFYAGRFVNVAVLAATLVVIYLILRQSRLIPIQRILLLAAVAFFPTTQWISSYIQPDNQSTFLICVCILLAQRLRSKPLSIPMLTTLAFVETLLAATKLHYALIAVVAIFLAVRPSGSQATRPRVFIFTLFAGIVPMIAIALVPRTLPAGSFHGSNVDTAYGALGYFAVLKLAVANLIENVQETFLGGRVFESFWFHFGIRRASALQSIGGLSNAFKFGVLIISLCAIGFAAYRAVTILRRLRIVAKQRGWAIASNLLGRDIHLNVWLLLTLLLFALSTLENGNFELQGRYWYPLLISTFLLAVTAAATGKSRSTRQRQTTVACAALATLSFVLTPSCFAAMQDDFYESKRGAPTVELGEITNVFVDGRRANTEGLAFPDRSYLTVIGVALDASRGLAATDLRYAIDGKTIGQLPGGLENDHLARIFNDPMLERAGFRLDFRPIGLSKGRHRLAILAIESRAPQGIPVVSLSFWSEGKS